MYTVRPPRPALRPFVRLLWAAEGSRAPAGVTREHVLPTGDMHLVFRLSAEPLRLFDDAGDVQGRTVGRTIIGGARSSFYARDVSMPSASVGAVLRPGAATLLFGGGAGELARRHTRLDSLWGRAADIALDRLLESETAERKLAVLEAVLAARLPRVRGLHPAVAYAIERFHHSESVGVVVGRTGYSHRHFISVFRASVGLTPKEYCRVLRFQRAMRRMSRDPEAPRVELALAAGYSDQAHFNREFRVFAGVTPNVYCRIAPDSPNHLPLSG